jgi:N-acetylmuramoyl-L-alanine amidase
METQLSPPRLSRRSLCTLGGLCVPAFVVAVSAVTGAAGQGSIATIKDIRRAVLADAVRITIELDREVPFREERIPDPVRVFVDLPGTRASQTLADRTLRFDADSDIVHQIRVGRHPNNTTRVVLDAIDVTTYSVYPLYNPFRIVIDCMRGSARAMTAVAPPPPPRPPLTARRIADMSSRRLPSSIPRKSAILREAHAAVADEETPAVVATQTQTSVRPAAVERVAAVPAAPGPESGSSSGPPPKNSTGSFSISRQLGLGVSRIVIDAGHGGHDPGAKGKGISEAELVLDVALRLEALLQKVPGVEVILTRRTDEFIALQERTAIANREGADLFLSIHANASPNAMARGIETYFLNFANNLSAAAVAARENAASGQTMAALPDIVKTIALNNKLDESRDFATQIQHAMVDRLRSANKTIKDLGVKQAPFVVLIGAAMPSVLAEISFVTNPQEVKLLKGNPYRQRIAEALFAAIRKYQTSLKSATAVASQ